MIEAGLAEIEAALARFAAHLAALEDDMSTAGASRANLCGAASERGSRKLQITKARRPCTTVTHLRNDEALGL